MSTVNAVKPHPRRPSPRAPVAALGVGLLLTVITLIVSVVDQTSVHGLADHVHALYAPFNQHPDPNVLFTILYSTGTLGVLAWLATIWGALRHKRGVRVGASLIFVVATGIALLDLFASEHGTQVLPTTWGILGLSPVPRRARRCHLVVEAHGSS